jgi:hypothetical protein
MNVGDDCVVIERVSSGAIFGWDGVVERVAKDFIETKHHRNALTHPQWMDYARAYADTWTRHFTYGGMMNLTPKLREGDVIEYALSERGGFIVHEVHEDGYKLFPRIKTQDGYVVTYKNAIHLPKHIKFTKFKTV